MLYIHFLYLDSYNHHMKKYYSHFTKYNSEGDILFNTNVPNFKPIILSLCATFIVGYLKQLFFLSSDSSTQCSSCSSPPRAQVFLHRHPSSQARGEGMTGHHVAKTLKQPMKTKLWEEQPASHKHPAILCQPCVQATWDLGPITQASLQKAATSERSWAMTAQLCHSQNIWCAETIWHQMSIF